MGDVIYSSIWRVIALATGRRVVYDDRAVVKGIDPRASLRLCWGRPIPPSAFLEKCFAGWDTIDRILTAIKGNSDKETSRG